jgi:hypothetical protein
MAFMDILPIFLARDFGDEALILFGLSKSLWNSDELLSIACNYVIGPKGETRLGRQCRKNGGNRETPKVVRTKILLALPTIDVNKYIGGRVIGSASLITQLKIACGNRDAQTVKL